MDDIEGKWTVITRVKALVPGKSLTQIFIGNFLSVIYTILGIRNTLIGKT